MKKLTQSVAIQCDINRKFDALELLHAHEKAVYEINKAAGANPPRPYAIRQSPITTQFEVLPDKGKEKPVVLYMTLTAWDENENDR